VTRNPAVHPRSHDEVGASAAPEFPDVSNPVHARQLSATRGALAVLAPVHGGALSLVVGSGWGSIARAIANLGGRVVGIDRHIPVLSYANRVRDSHNEMFVSSDLLGPLPFTAASFDCVVLADRFSTSSTEGKNDRTADGLDGLLAECDRILKPGGTLVMEAPNRLSFLNLAGKSAIGVHGGRLELVPRAAARFYLSRRGGGGSVIPTRTRGGYSDALRRASFTEFELYVPWPDRLQWSRLWPVSTLKQTSLSFGDERRRDRLARRFFQVLKRLRIQQRFVPDYIYVARKRADQPRNPIPSVIELARKRRRGIDPAIREIRAYQNSGSVIFEDDEQVFKIPLTQRGRGRLLREKEALRHVANHPVASFAIQPAEYCMEAGVEWAVYPRAHPAGGEGRLDSARSVLRRLIDSATMESVHGTDAWRRLSGPVSREALGQVGADALLIGIQCRTAGKRVPVGLVHGDFALHNVLHGSEDEPVVIDWDRSERFSPVFLDVLAASHFHAFRELVGGGWGMDSYWAAWQLHFQADERLALGDELDQARGELDWTTMVAFGVLNTIHWNCSEGGPSLERNHTHYQRWTRECVRWMDGE
jgi:SAM-dependent methyltransferase